MPAHDYRDIPVEVIEAGGKYICTIPPLLLTASATDLGSAYAAVREKRDRLMAEVAASGIADHLYDAARSPSVQRGDLNLAAFSLRVFIIGCSTALLIVIAGATASSVARKASGAFAQRLETTLPFSRGWDKHAEALEGWLLDQSAKRNLPPPAEEARIRESIRILVQRFKPYFDEVRPLFQDSKPQSENDKQKTSP